MTTASSNKVQLILKSVDKLRPLPTSINRVLRSLEDPMSTAGMIAELIGLDQALAAQLLHCANSVAMGYNSTCSSIDDAVMRLGFNRVKTVVMGAGASGPLSARLDGYRLGAGGLWNHSIAAATAAGWIARAIQFSDPEEAYVSGLLHDIGKLLLDQFVHIEYQSVIEGMRKQHLSLWEVEEQLFGLDHGAVGGLMAEKWSFPVQLVDAIRFHHAPSLARSKPKLAAIANLANYFTPQDEEGLSGMDIHVLHPETCRILNLSESTAKQMRNDFLESQKMR